MALETTGGVPKPSLGLRRDPNKEIEHRLARIEEMLLKQQQLLEQAPAAMATVGNIVDSTVTRLHEHGVDVDERLRSLTRIATLATDPQILHAVERLLEHPAQVEELLSVVQQAPGTVAMTVNVVDGWIRRAIDRGLDPEAAARSTAAALEKLVYLMQSDEFAALMDSGVLSPESLEVVGKLAQSMQEAKAAPAGRTSLFGAMRAAGDARVQRALNFAIRLAESFGGRLDNNTRALPAPNPSSSEVK